jgi:superfamily I DNA and/or RNA helicase
MDSIIAYAAQIPTRFARLKNLKGLDDDSRSYLANVGEKVLDECNKDLSELQLVMTDGTVQMTDDERFKRLDEIYAGMKDKYAFTLSFCTEVRTLLLQKQQELNDINTLKRLNGID